VPGIGPWTARGFLLVALDRPDVFLSGDLALRRAPTNVRLRPPSDRRRSGSGFGPLTPVSEPCSELPLRIRIRRATVIDSVGIIGARRLGQAMARTALRAGRRVVIADSRGPESLTSVVTTLGEGVSAVTADDAAAARRAAPRPDAPRFRPGRPDRRVLGLPGGRAFAELLIDLEEDKAARRSCSGCSGRWSGSRQAARRAGYFEAVPASAAALGPHGPGRRMSMMGVLICLRLHWVWFVRLTARSLSRFGLGPLSG
jgi:hypothetical protein